MSCPDGKHDLRAVNPFIHPTAKDSDGNPLEIAGGPPQSEEEPAWCAVCGAFRCKKPFGVGWGFIHPLTDEDAPTLLNLIKEARDGKGSSDGRVDEVVALAEMFRSMADRLESGDDKGGLTGVVLVAEGAPGVFSEEGPMTGVWTSMQGGEQLLVGLRTAISDVKALRRAKRGKLQ